MVASTTATDGVEFEFEPGPNLLRVAYDALPLARGIYAVNVVVAEGTMNNQVLAALKKSEFEVRVPRGDFGAGVLHVRPFWDQAVTAPGDRGAD